jgi:hypothetical protein
VENGKKKTLAPLAAAAAAAPQAAAAKKLDALPALGMAGMPASLLDDPECPPMDTAEDLMSGGFNLAGMPAAPADLIHAAAAALPAGVVNIDLEESDNPQMAAEYILEIDAYMRHLEVKQAPAANYMETLQGDLRVDMRAILIDWLVEVHQRFKLIQETLFLTIHILDRYLSVQPVPRARLQLIGVCSMLIASKYEEMYPPEVQDFIWVARNAYTRADIITTEGLILRALDFDLGTPLPLHFLRRDSRAGNSTPEIHNMAKYMMEVAVANYAMLAFAPSQIAAGALDCAREAMGAAPVWDATVAHYAGYSAAELAPCVAGVRRALSTAEQTLPAVFKKFGDAKVLSVSSRPEMQGYVAACKQQQ